MYQIVQTFQQHFYLVKKFPILLKILQINEQVLHFSLQLLSVKYTVAHIVFGFLTEVETISKLQSAQKVMQKEKLYPIILLATAMCRSVKFLSIQLSGILMHRELQKTTHFVDLKRQQNAYFVKCFFDYLAAKSNFSGMVDWDTK